MTDFIGRASEEVNTTTAGDQGHAVVAESPSGGHMVVWTTTDSYANAVAVMAQPYDASGARNGPELTLASGYGAGGIAALADGSFVVSLTKNTLDPNSGPHSAVYYAHYDSAGHALGSPVLVDDTGTYDVAVSGGAVFALPGGGFALVDTSTTRPTPVSTITHSTRVFDALGSPVDAIAAGENFRPQIQEMASGGYVIADQPYTGPGPSRISWQAVDAQGHVIAGAQLNSTYGQVDYESPSVVALANGGAVVVWGAWASSNGAWSAHWQAQLVDAGGHAAGAPVDWNYSANSTPQLTALAQGGFLASWLVADAAQSSYELYAQAFDASAQASGSVEHLGTLGYDYPAYSISATPDGGFLLDWQATADGQDIFEQKFDVVPDAPGGSTPGGIAVHGGPTVIPAGNYAITGSAGIDTIAFGGAHTQYDVTPASVSGPEGTDSLSGIERIIFSDGFGIALDINGDAGEAYRLYQAAFDRAPDLAGLGYHIHDLDRGVPLWLVAQHFIDSPEFQATYGATDETQFITLLYQNVLHRAPDAGGLQFHLDEFAHGESRADMLCHFSESPENQANVIGQIENGMLYVPLA